jgi:hypothetical protein
MSGGRTGPLAALLATLACVDAGSYGVRSHYQTPEPETREVTPLLVSAHLGSFGEEPAALDEAAEGGAPRMVEGSERSEDRILLLFAVELDPLTVSPLAFGIMRADGRRVRPTRVFLAPADEGDENRSLTLVGNFGSAEAPPVAVHVLGKLYAETGEELRNLDANISAVDEPDRPLLAERLEPNPSRCPGARQVIRTYWSDVLTQVGDADLAGIQLILGDGRTLAPSGFDDQARREGDEYPCAQPFSACLGRADDNVLDLCVDSDAAVVHVRFAAGLFEDAAGHPSAAAELDLTPLPPS